MAWVEIKVDIIPKGPLHIGHLRYGFINKTKTYLPYYVVNSLFNKILYTEFKLTFTKDILKSTSFIFYKADKLIDQEEFKSKYIFSKTSSAIDNTTRTAKESSLFNIEYIYAFDKKEKISAKGSIFVKPEYLDKLEHILKKYKDSFLIGGESKAGFGKVDINITDILQNPSIKRTINKGDYLLELIRLEKDLDFIDGEKEVLFLRKTKSYQNHGKWFWYEGLFFSPYSKAIKDVEIDVLNKTILC